MITSVQNNQVKLWRKLRQRKYREQTRLFLVEGYHTIEEARNSNWEILHIMIREKTDVPKWAKQYDVISVSDHVFDHITHTQSPQGIAAIVKRKQHNEIDGNAVLLIDEIQDPGNLGTIIRTADAAGFNGIVLGDGTVDLFNEKVIRATQGSLFHLPIIQKDLRYEIDRLKSLDFTILVSDLHNATNYSELTKQEKFALVVGNEGAGVSVEIKQMADQLVKIPIYGKAESLNVSVAAGILMYELKQ